MLNFIDYKIIKENKLNWLISILILFISWIILYFHADYYMPFISDDSLISLRYAERFIQGEGLTWTDGQPVEGYSNLLWILLISLGGFIGFDLIDISRILGAMCMGMVIFALVYYCHSLKKQFIAALTTSFLIALSGPVAIWAIGGLEQPLVACLLAWIFVFLFKIINNDINTYKYVWLASLTLGLLSITRPDGIIFTVTAVLSLLILKRNNLKLLSLVLRMVSFPFVMLFGQYVFRLIYYGEWLPNPALVKISPSWHHFINGFNYLKNGLTSLNPFTGIVVLFLLYLIIRRKSLDQKFKNRFIVLMVPFLTWSAYVIFIGGDIFPAFRHIIPLLVILAFFVIDVTSWFSKNLKRKVVIIGNLLLWLCLLSWFGRQQFSHPENKRAVHERWEWDGQVIGSMLKEGFSENQPLLAVTAAGCLPYWSGLPSVDMYGLNDYYIPRHPPC